MIQGIKTEKKEIEEIKVNHLSTESRNNLEDKLLDFNKDFENIKSRMNNYKNNFLRVVATYITIYIVSLTILYLFSSKLTGISNNLLENMTAILIGGFFIFDGNISSSFKTPFNQLCYSINKSSHINEKVKGEIIGILTSSIEVPKDTIKKFGVMSVAGTITEVCRNIRSKKDEKIEWSTFIKGEAGKKGDSAFLAFLPYVYPLFFSVYEYIRVRGKLNRVEKKYRNNMINGNLLIDKNI